MLNDDYNVYSLPESWDRKFKKNVALSAKRL